MKESLGILIDDEDIAMLLLPFWESGPTIFRASNVDIWYRRACGATFDREILKNLLRDFIGACEYDYKSGSEKVRRLRHTLEAFNGE